MGTSLWSTSSPSVSTSWFLCSISTSIFPAKRIVFCPARLCSSSPSPTFFSHECTASQSNLSPSTKHSPHVANLTWIGNAVGCASRCCWSTIPCSFAIAYDATNCLPWTFLSSSAVTLWKWSSMVTISAICTAYKWPTPATIPKQPTSSVRTTPKSHAREQTIQLPVQHGSRSKTRTSPKPNTKTPTKCSLPSHDRQRNQVDT